MSNSRLPGVNIEPATYRVLVKKQQLEKKTEAGIVLPEDVVEAEEAAINIGKIVALGESAGVYFYKTYGAEWPFQLGDMVLYRRHHGFKLKDPVSGESYVLLNDEHIEAKYLADIKESVSIYDRQ